MSIEFGEHRFGVFVGEFFRFTYDRAIGEVPKTVENEAPTWNLTLGTGEVEAVVKKIDVIAGRTFVIKLFLRELFPEPTNFSIDGAARFIV